MAKKPKLFLKGDAMHRPVDSRYHPEPGTGPTVQEASRNQMPQQPRVVGKPAEVPKPPRVVGKPAEPAKPDWYNNEGNRNFRESRAQFAQQDAADAAKTKMNTQPPQPPSTTVAQPASKVAQKSLKKSPGHTVAMPSRPTSDADRAQVASQKPNASNVRVKTPVTYQGKKYTVTETAGSWMTRQNRAEAVASADRPKQSIQPGSIASRASRREAPAPAPASGTHATRSTAPRRSAIVGKGYAPQDTAAYQFRKETERMHRRVQGAGAGKRARRRAQLAAFGKALTFQEGTSGHRADTFHGHYNITPQRSGSHAVSYSMHKEDAKKRYGTAAGAKHAELGTHATHAAAVSAAQTHHKETHQKLLGKADTWVVMSIADVHAEMMKADAPAGPGTPGPANGPTKKFSRKESAAVQMRAVADGEAVANVKSSKTKKSLVMLAAIKALATGYGKVSGGGALRAANRSMTLFDLNHVGKGRSVKDPHNLAPRTDPHHDFGTSDEPKKPEKKPTVPVRPSWVYGDDSKPSVEKANTGDSAMSKTNFNDLFKSELGIAVDETLVDCPHCEAPITKSDLTKAASFAKQNGGRTMHGGSGKGQVASKRPGSGAQKTDAVVGIQNNKGSKTRKSDVESEDGSIEKGEEQDQQVAAPVRKSNGGSVRGTDYVQYVNYGDAPGSDAHIAKSIAEAQGALGQEATQPMDLNNDLSRLLV